MIYIGNHVSSSKGFAAMGKKEIELGGNTFAFFTRNPRGGNAKKLSQEDVKQLQEIMKQQKFGPLVAHAPYTMNLCAAKQDVRDFSKAMLLDDLNRMEYLPGNYYNFHPGSHVGQGTERGIKLIAAALAGVPEHLHTTILLETMSGKGSEVGGRFEEIQVIIQRVEELRQKECSWLGVCLDTCHVWDGGYNIVDHLDEVLEEFDQIIGLDRLKALHLNDSMNVCGSHKDRHQKLGQGKIGLEALRQVTMHTALQEKPFILETPNEDEGYAKEIALVKTWMK